MQVCRNVTYIIIAESIEINAMRASLYNRYTMIMSVHKVCRKEMSCDVYINFVEVFIITVQESVEQGVGTPPWVNVGH